MTKSLEHRLFQCLSRTANLISLSVGHGAEYLDESENGLVKRNVVNVVDPTPDERYGVMAELKLRYHLAMTHLDTMSTRKSVYMNRRTYAVEKTKEQALNIPMDLQLGN